MVAIPLNRVPVPHLCLRGTVGFPIFSPLAHWASHLNFHTVFSLAPAWFYLKQVLKVVCPYFLGWALMHFTYQMARAAMYLAVSVTSPLVFSTQGEMMKKEQLPFTSYLQKHHQKVLWVEFLISTQLLLFPCVSYSHNLLSYMFHFISVFSSTWIVTSFHYMWFHCMCFFFILVTFDILR